MTRAGRPKKAAGISTRRPRVSQSVPAGVRSPSGRPECPASVAADQTALQMWDWLVSNLEAMGILTLSDRLALEMIANDYAELQSANAIVKRDGMILKGEKGGKYSHPALNVANSARKRIHSALSDLGLTPRAREQLNLQLAEVRKSALAEFRNAKPAKRGKTK
ncbi:phage terminase small subunit P27 family [Planctomicrobium sp. SH661]|uniref:phage terminase small subunit P27 family n=1 Tax=Planctomicrobium sp. SH661 TaxID=3448124 RepID=UPI003F5AF730